MGLGDMERTRLTDRQSDGQADEGHFYNHLSISLLWANVGEMIYSHCISVTKTNTHLPDDWLTSWGKHKKTNVTDCGLFIYKMLYTSYINTII